MADLGYVTRLLAGIPDETTRRVLTEVFKHVLGNLRYGVPEHQQRAVNFQAYFEQSTTATSTGEFTFRHGLATAPRLAIPVLDLNTVGSRLVPLEVSRAADGARIYLKSTSTGAPITLVIE